MNHFLDIEKCRKLKSEGIIDNITQGDWVYVVFEKWTNVDATTKKLVTTTEKTIFDDMGGVNRKYAKFDDLVKIPSLDDFFRILDADLSSVDCLTNTITSSRKVMVGYDFNNSQSNENIKIDGPTMHDALYNMAMLLYSKKK